jgi:hypothetical protein
MRSRSLLFFENLLASGFGAGGAAGAALRLTSALLRGSGRLDAARRGAALALAGFFNLLALDAAFLPAIASLLTPPVI